jgi:hypothetical protein
VASADDAPRMTTRPGPRDLKHAIAEYVEHAERYLLEDFPVGGNLDVRRGGFGPGRWAGDDPDQWLSEYVRTDIAALRHPKTPESWPCGSTRLCPPPPLRDSACPVLGREAGPPARLWNAVRRGARF